MKQKNPVLHLVNEIEIPKWLLFFSVLLSIIGSIFQLIVPLFTQNIVDNFSEVIKGSGTEIIFSQNLFRCITPARMTRFEKSLIQAHFQISQLLTKW